jgi:hypothetical protein
MLSVIMLSVIELSIVMLSVVVLSVVMLIIVKLEIITLSVNLPSIVMFIAIMLSVVLLNVKAPKNFAKKVTPSSSQNYIHHLILQNPFVSNSRIDCNKEECFNWETSKPSLTFWCVSIGFLRMRHLKGTPLNKVYSLTLKYKARLEKVC